MTVADIHAHSSPRGDAPYLIEGSEIFLEGCLEGFPTDSLVSQAMVCCLFQAIGDKKDYPAVMACSILVRALETMGWEAEIIPSSLTIYYENGASVVRGETRKLQNVSMDGATDGHPVIWIDRMKRAIDIPLGFEESAPILLNNGMVRRYPGIYPISLGRQQFLSSQNAIPRHRSLLTYNFFPEWVSIYEPFLAARSTDIARAADSLVHVTVDLLRVVASLRDIDPMEEFGARLARLL